VSIVSRGYGAEAGSRNDEAMELEQKLPDVPHVQDADRVAGARVAIEELQTQLIVLDDAFQHRRIARDLDLVLLDALEPFGFEHVFPRGMLREPPSSLRRADAIVLTRADMLAPAERTAIRQRALRDAPQAVWAEAAHAPRGLRNALGEEQPLDALAGQPVAAFAAIGNPAGFRHTLELCGCRVIAFREFADHYRYARADVESLAAWAAGQGAAAVVCTHKDLVKLGVDRLGTCPLWAVTVALEFLAGEAALVAKFAELLPRALSEGSQSAIG
jgi:tetraacyldisaccharide 4'-kinase